MGATPHPLFFQEGITPLPPFRVSGGYPTPWFQQPDPVFRVESSPERVCRKRPEGVANTPLPIIFSSGGYPPPMDLGRFGPDKFRQRGKIAWLLFRTG